MSNRTLYYVVACATLVLTGAMLIAAVQHGLWKEFTVSFGVVILSAGASIYLLKRPS